MRRLLLPIVLFGSTAACATILDFQESTDRITTADGTDAMDAGQSMPGPSSSAPTSAPTSTSTPTATPSSSSSEPSEPDTIDAGGTTPNEPEDAGTIDAGGTTPSDPKDAGPVVVEPPPVVVEPPPPVVVEPPPPVAVCSSCIPYAPSGFRGPFVVAEGSSNIPDCVGDYPVSAYSGHSGFTADRADCTCSCGSPSGIACSVPTTSFYSDAKCATTACHVDGHTHACADNVSCDVPSNKVVAATFSASTPSGGSCAPSASTRVTPATWQKTIHLCAPRTTQSDCAGGVCQPTPSPSFQSQNRCVIQDGNVAQCPSAFPVRQVFFSGGSDTRTCTACTCGAPQGVSCYATVTTGSSSSCREPTTFTAASGCVEMPTNEHVVVSAGLLRGTGACSPIGGKPVGSFDPGTPTTVCCLE